MLQRCAELVQMKNFDVKNCYTSILSDKERDGQLLMIYGVTVSVGTPRAYRKLPMTYKY